MIKKLLFFLLVPTALFSKTISEIYDNKIESVHVGPSETYLFINDGSTWVLNPSDEEWIINTQEELTDCPITVMPEAGSEDYPVRIVLKKTEEKPCKSLTIKLESPPTQPQRTVISEIQINEGFLSQIMIIKQNDPEAKKSTMLINPQDLMIVNKWTSGQRVLIGGLWLPEYDPVGQKNYNPPYLVTIYNYDTQDFAFFSH